MPERDWVGDDDRGSPVNDDRGWPVNVDPMTRQRLRGVVDEITQEPPAPDDASPVVGSASNDRAWRRLLAKRYPQG